MTPLRADVAVIGGGPAGLAAATAAARAGALVHLLDGAAEAGGQYWMQPIGVHASPQSLAGAAAITAARGAGVQIHPGADVWAVFDRFRILAAIGAEPLEIAARAIVVASGAQDRVPAFPGWTLPGVLTAGAAQRLAKLGGVRAGRRVVVAGSGPFLLVVAGVLRTLDTELVAFVEARRPAAASALHLARFPERWGEALQLLRPIADTRTRRRFGWIVTEALGTDHVEAVRIARLDANGAIDERRTHVIDGIDALVTGWGFRPSIEVTAQLGCAHAFDDARGGWFCETDPATARTSIAGVYAAGEVTGVAGALGAQLTGSIAGASAATELGFPAPAAPARAGQRRRLARAAAFAAGINALYAPPPALAGLARADTIVCRCESVTAAEIRRAHDDGVESVYGAKAWTRAGMGRCQGRMCGWSIAQLLARDGNDARPGFNAPRIPLRPVSLDVVAAALDDDER
jgi:NADPH-dependent 2,4-dienoyl-CoA reductase/sulfur reductase-like enzyme